MPRDVPDLFMRSSQKQKREWFRAEAAWVDAEHKTADTTPIYIYDEIGGGWFGGTGADDFVQMLSTIKTPEIELHINCPGGEIFDGVAIYNALMSHPAKVTVIVDALAASAASFIAQAGDEIIMTEAATMMIHDGSAMAYGPASVMRDTADLLDHLSNIAAGIYAKHAGKTAKFWRAVMIEEAWYNAQEAVDAGLATSVGSATSEEDKSAAQNKWDLSVFNHAGRLNAPNPIAAMQRIADQMKEHDVPDNETPEEKATREAAEAQAAADAEAAAAAAAGTPVETDEEKAAREEAEAQAAAAAAAPPVAPPPPTPAAPVPTDVAPTAFQFKLAGQTTNDFSAVQARLDVLEQYRTETMTAARRNFVLKLAEDKKIGAPQIAKLTEYALKQTDEGYAAWAATYDDAPQLGMLAYDGPGGGSQTPEGVEADKELTVCKEIVAQHKMGRMSTEQIMETPSYKRLMELDPNYKL